MQLTGGRFRTIGLAICFCALAGAVGCSQSNKSAPAQGTVIPVPQAAPNANASLDAQGGPGASGAALSSAAGGSGLASVPAHLDIGTGSSLTPTPDLDKRIAALEEGSGSKKQLSLLYAKRGMERMMDGQASPHVKYPAALEDFRQAAKLDPSDKGAVSNMNLIESIYKSMGRPIPGG